MPTAIPALAAEHERAGKTLSVRLTPDEHRRIHDVAWERRTTASALAREALRASLPLDDRRGPAAA
jgi:predicted transcriptional regulator